MNFDLLAFFTIYGYPNKNCRLEVFVLRQDAGDMPARKKAPASYDAGA
jgi:hypothetical protein